VSGITKVERFRRMRNAQMTSAHEALARIGPTEQERQVLVSVFVELARDLNREVVLAKRRARK
jgi:hypothetical protein